MNVRMLRPSWKVRDALTMILMSLGYLYMKSKLNEANKRLIIMSSGQFILKCRKLEDLSSQGEIGLELDIYSMVNEQNRDVRTVSGGESFMAALAMALSIVSIIQNTAGNIHIDTMIIDEGFGLLSDETRCIQSHSS